MVILQCKCGATVERKRKFAQAVCDACKNATFRDWRSNCKGRANRIPAAGTWYQSNKEAIKFARAAGLSVPEARRRLAGEQS